MADFERTHRTNKIVKVYAKDFTIKVLRDIIIDYVTTGTDAWTCVKNDLEETIFKVPNFVDGEYGYCGMKYDEIRKGKTYREWLYKPENLRKHIIYNPDCYNNSPIKRVEAGNGMWSVYGEPTVYNSVPSYKSVAGGTELNHYIQYYGWNSSNPPIRMIEAEAFHADANVLFFTMFKQYEEGIQWEDRMGNERSTTKAKHITYLYPNSPTYSYFDKPPLYPGEGCPVVGAAPNFYKDNDKGNEIVFVYLSRTKHNILIVINFQKYWDFAQFGFFEPYDTIHEYAFPAMVMSSNIGTRPQVSLEYNPTENVYPYFLYDYTHKNTSLGRTMPCCAASYWNGNIDFINEYGNSPIQAVEPSGKWHSFVNYGIRSESYRNQQLGLGLWHSYKEPERVNANYYLTVNHSDTKRTKNTINTALSLSTFNWDYESVDDLIDKENNFTYDLMPYMMVMSDKEGTNVNILGNIPATFYVPKRVVRYGVYKHDDDVFLIVPNCEENRRWHMNPYYGVFLNNKSSNDYMQEEKDRIDEISDNMNTAFNLGENLSVDWWGV